MRGTDLYVAFINLRVVSTPPLPIQTINGLKMSLKIREKIFLMVVVSSIISLLYNIGFK